jgi:hypothetical protein
VKNLHLLEVIAEFQCSDYTVSPTFCCQQRQQIKNKNKGRQAIESQVRKDLEKNEPGLTDWYPPLIDD